MMRLIHLSGFLQNNIEQIARILRNQVIRDYKDPKRLYFVRKVALKIVSNCPPKDYLCECRKIVKWIHKNFRYVKDPHGIELFISPYLLLKRGLKDKSLAQGDCETLAQLVALMCMSLGHRAKLLLLDTTGDRNYNHCIALISPRHHGWYYADVTVSPKLSKIPLTRIYKKYEIPLEVK